MTREELENLKKIVAQEEARLNEAEKEPEKKPKVWKPKLGEAVYTLFSDGTISELGYFKQQKDCLDNTYLQGNLFHTEEEAKFESERRKVIKELQDFATENNEPIDWNDSEQYKGCIYYDGIDKKLGIWHSYLYKYSDIFFSSDAIAKQAIEQIGEERIKKYYLRVEE